MSSESVLLERIRTVATEIAPFADRIEAERRLPEPVLTAMRGAGVFKLAVPQVLGGAEARPTTILAALEALAHADGSAGWCAMVGVTSGLMSGFLEEPVARTIYGADDAITCGVFAPMGRARRVDGGLLVSGRWPFASGCESSSYRMGGVIVESDPPDLLPSGAPHVRSVVFRADETRVIDTWDTSGLRGTGSHDIEATAVLVPTSRMFSLFTDAPWPKSSLYRVPFFGLLSAGIAGVAIGIAHSAVEALIALARSKRSVGSKRGIGHRELVQLAVATADTKVRAARALLHTTMDRVAAAAEAGAVSLHDRALLRAAACHATTEAAAAVDLAYEAGGGSSIYKSNVLQRAFRDVHTATQHVMVQKTSATLAGRILLDIESDTSTL